MSFGGPSAAAAARCCPVPASAASHASCGRIARPGQAASQGQGPADTRPGDEHGLAAHDGPTWRRLLRRLVPAAEARVTARLLDLACRHPDLDREGRYASHLHAVTSDFLRQHPVLWH